MYTPIIYSFPVFTHRDHAVTEAVGGRGEFVGDARVCGGVVAAPEASELGRQGQTSGQLWPCGGALFSTMLDCGISIV